MDSAQPRALLVRLSALGDILHALPALAGLRAALPGAFIGWLVEDGGAPLLEGHPMLDALHVMPRRAFKKARMKTLVGPMRRLLGEVRANRYDVAIDFQGLTKSAVWTRLSGARRRVGFAGEDARELSRLFYNAAVARREDEFHVIRRNLSLLRPLGIEVREPQFPIHLPAEAKVHAAAIWGTENPGAPRVVINPGAGWPTKQWPAACYGALARELVQRKGARVAISWGPSEKRLVREALRGAGEEVLDDESPFTRSSVGGEPGVYPLPPTSFMELGAVLAGAQLMVAGDTGPAHLAAALGVPTVSVFGASDPKRNGPWGEKARIIQLTEPACIPCWKTRCAWSEPLACLTGVGLERPLEAALEALKSAGL